MNIQSPGSQRVPYWRPSGVGQRVVPTSRTNSASVDTALLALASDASRGDVLPLLHRALPQAELLHRSLIALLGDPPPHCAELFGKSETGALLNGHRHAHFVPLDLDHDGRLDHVLVYAPMGLGGAAQDALRRLRRTWTKGGDKPLFVTLAGMGMLQEFRRFGGEDVPELAASQRWVSRTPFVPPRHVKRNRHSVIDQVRAELQSRGLPEARSIVVAETRLAVEKGFHRFIRRRKDPTRQPPGTTFFHITVELTSPVRGPILLGYASHFGLGVFVPTS